MKTLIQLLIFFTVICASAQYKWSPATLYFKDGTTLQGEAKIKQVPGLRMFPKESIKYRAEKKGKSQKFKASAIDSINFTVSYTQKVNKQKIKKTRKATFITRKISDNKRHLHFLELLKNGVVQLYGNTYGAGSSMNFMPAGSVKTPTAINMSNSSMPSYGGHNRLYVSKDNTVVKLLFLRKDIIHFFKDCKALVKKIKSEKLGEEDLNTIVDYYNNNCN